MDIIAKIDSWAELSPEQPAHISGDRTLTYAELRRQTDALAAWLHRREPGARGAVAIVGQREPEMVVGFLGCVKAGLAYVPVDASLPPQRIEAIVSRTDLALRPAEIAQIVQTPGEAPPLQRALDDPWYIMFTSGSTGAPKGVVLTGRCLETFLEWLLAEQKFTERDEVFLNQVPFTFDLSIADMYGALLTGGTLFSLSREVQMNSRALFQALRQSRATFSLATPSFARVCLSEPTYGAEMMGRMRKFLFCGETLPRETAAQMMKRFPGAEIWNTYGPTEATVAMTSVLLDPPLLERYPALPIGRVMPGVEVWLIDEELRSLGTEGRGEIVISGPNVTPGYLDAPEKNAAAFIYQDGKRGYRTGDLGHFSDGFLFCEGRLDGQIKFNGYRIELGDIEANLRALPGVREAVVVAVRKEDVVQSFAAFVMLAERDAGDTGEEFATTQRLKTALLERLPSYMLPRKFIYVEEFPVTPHGKVDRRQLAARLT